MFKFYDHEDYFAGLIDLTDEQVIKEFCFCRDSLDSIQFNDGFIGDDWEPEPNQDFITMLSMCVEVLASRGVKIKHREWRQ